MNQIECKIENGIAVLEINRPEAMNALSRRIVDVIDDEVQSISENPEVRVLIIYGSKNFAAGADISEMADMNCQEAKRFAFSPTFSKIESLAIPTIAAIEGYALGGGLELALTCDMRIASEKAVMGFPEIKLGIMPGAGGTVRACRLIGAAKTKEMIFMGGNLSAGEALGIGLVNKVVSEGTTLEEAKNWAQKIMRMAPLAVKTAKNTIDEANKENNVADGIAIEAENWANLFNTEDQKEGMKAFLEKRRPVYKGK